MAPGPHLIFDKSALECLSLDESNWLDNFYGTVITPLFFAETLADLEKEVEWLNLALPLEISGDNAA